MQHVHCALHVHLSSSRGAHSTGRQLAASGDKPRYRGTHSTGTMVRGIKSTLALGMVAVVLACACAPLFATAASPQQATVTSIDTTQFKGAVNSVQVDMPAHTAATLLNSKSFYFAQSAPGRCTVASAAMMLRRAAFLDSRKWKQITEESVARSAWTAAGLKNSFTSYGMQVSYHQFPGGSASAQELLDLLLEHPEGVVVYDSTLPHAVVLTDYDRTTGTFYAADPAGPYAGKRRALADTWNGANRAGQEGVIANLTAYWAIEG